MSRVRKNYTPEEKVAILKRHLVEKVPVSDLCDELGLNPTVFYGWQKQFFCEEEKQAILAYEREYPLEGYRRLAFMMLDDDVAAASPATVYRVLKSADRLGRPSPSNERKGKGFHQPGRPHRHWHIDFSHLNI